VCASCASWIDKRIHEGHEKHEDGNEHFGLRCTISCVRFVRFVDR
jgi:hypothetical protein